MAYDQKMELAEGRAGNGHSADTKMYSLEKRIELVEKFIQDLEPIFKQMQQAYMDDEKAIELHTERLNRQGVRLQEVDKLLAVLQTKAGI